MALGPDAFLYQSTPGVMGPCVRRDDGLCDPLCDCPTGKSVRHADSCPAPPAKIFLFFRIANQRYMIPIPSCSEGRAHVTNVGRAAVDATASGAQRRLQGEMNL